MSDVYDQPRATTGTSEDKHPEGEPGAHAQANRGDVLIRASAPDLTEDREARDIDEIGGQRTVAAPGGSPDNDQQLPGAAQAQHAAGRIGDDPRHIPHAESWPRPAAEVDDETVITCMPAGPSTQNRSRNGEDGTAVLGVSTPVRRAHGRISDRGTSNSRGGDRHRGKDDHGHRDRYRDKSVHRNPILRCARRIYHRVTNIPGIRPSRIRLNWGEPALAKAVR